MRIVFLGSGAFAIPCFTALQDAGHEVLALVTQPDKEKGRGRGLAPPPLKPVAQARGVRVLQPRRVRDEEAQEELRLLAPDLQVVVAYGQILPRAVIDNAPLGTVNVHASLLPLYRGAAPIQWAIVRGERETGVTTMRIDEGLDTGPLLLARRTAIGDEETAADLQPRLAALGAELMVETAAGLAAGTLAAVPQDHARATLAPLIRKEDGRVDWTAPSDAIERRVRGFLPWPGAFTTADGGTLKLLRARVAAAPSRGEPGQIVSASREGITVACGGGTAILLLELQPESRPAMPASAYAAGRRLKPGARLGP